MSQVICKIENCNKLVRIKKLGMCQMHETRIRNHNDPNFERKITPKVKCKVDDCDVVVFIKKHLLCMKHYQQLRMYGDPTHKKQRRSLTPLHIPGGEIIWNTQKAKKIIGIVEEIEKMIMCGFIDNDLSFMAEIEKIIEEGRYSKTWFFKKYINPLIQKEEFYNLYFPYGKEISNLVEEIIKKDKVVNDTSIKLLNLKPFGIGIDNNEFYFIDSERDLGKKVCELDIDLDKDEDYVICYKLQIHFKRYKNIIRK